MEWTGNELERGDGLRALMSRGGRKMNSGVTCRLKYCRCTQTFNSQLMENKRTAILHYREKAVNVCACVRACVCAVYLCICKPERKDLWKLFSAKPSSTFEIRKHQALRGSNTLREILMGVIPSGFFWLCTAVYMYSPF
jgi:hypothetical protein